MSMRNVRRRWQALLLSAVMLFTLLPAPAFAVPAGTDEKSIPASSGEFDVMRGTDDNLKLSAEIQETDSAGAESDGEIPTTDETASDGTDAVLTNKTEANAAGDEKSRREDAEENETAFLMDEIEDEVTYRIVSYSDGSASDGRADANGRAVVVGADSSKTSGNYVLFDENGSYTILLDESRNYSGGFPGNLAFPVTVEFSVRDAKTQLSRGSEISHPFAGVGEDNAFSVGAGHKFTLGWQDYVHYEYNQNGFHSGTAYASSFDEDGGYTIRLGSGITLPLGVTFSWRGADGTMITSDGTFSGRNDEVTVNGHRFKIEIPGVGETTVTLDSSSFDFGRVHYSSDDESVRFGGDAERAEQAAEQARDNKMPSYMLYAADRNVLTLRESDSFPVTVGFEWVESDGTVVHSDGVFSKPGDTVTKNNHVFTVEADWFDDTIYTFHDTTVTVGRGTEKAESAAQSAQSDGTTPDYVLYENNGHTIIADRDTDTFPLSVSYSYRGSAETKVVRSDAEFTLPDSAASLGGHPFTVHSLWPNTTRYRTSGGSGTVDSGTVGNNAELAEAAAKRAADTGREPSYVLFESDGTHSVAVTEFPTTVAISHWEPSGWSDWENREVRDPNDTIPVSGGTLTFGSDWLWEIQYVIDSSGQSGTVGDNAERAEKDDSYDVWTDNNYVIQPTSYLEFPVSVTFTVRNGSTSQTVIQETFESEGDQKEIRGHQFSIRKTWTDWDVDYEILGSSGTVGTDREKERLDANYDLFSSDGSYTVNPGGQLTFPCTVQFTLYNSDGTTLTSDGEFQGFETQVKLWDHTFRIRSEWLNDIHFSGPGVSGTAGQDAEYAKINSSYGLFEPDGSYVIDVAGDTVKFPLTVTFNLPLLNVSPQSEKRVFTRVFSGPDDVQEFEGHKFSLHLLLMDEIQYTLNGRTVTIGLDADRAAQAQKTAKSAGTLPDYVLGIKDKEDGKYKYTIQLESDAFFPYGVDFTFGQRSEDDGIITYTTSRKKLFFDGPKNEAEDKSIKEVRELTPGSFKIYAESPRVDRAKLIRAGLDVGGSYIPLVRSQDAKAYWHGDEEETAGLLSLLPIREVNLYANLQGQFPSELENVRLLTWTGGSPNGQDAVMLAPPADGQFPYGDNYQSTSRSRTFAVTGGRYKMITNTSEQLDPGNIRYVIDMDVSAPGYDNLLELKAAYEEGERGGFRVKYDSYTAHADGIWRGSDQEPRPEERAFAYKAASGKWTYVDLYSFETDQTWTDGNLSIVMKRDETNTFFKDLEADVYAGVYFSEKEIEDAKIEPITDQVWEKELDKLKADERYNTRFVNGSVDESPLFTVVWRRSGENGQTGHVVAVRPFRAVLNASTDTAYSRNSLDKVIFSGLRTHNTIQKDAKDQNLYYVDTDIPSDGTFGLAVRHFKTPNSDSAFENRFYIKALYLHYKDNRQIPPEEGGTWQDQGVRVYASDKAYSSLEELKSDGTAQDVTTQILFNNEDTSGYYDIDTAGYGADFSKGIVFSVFDADGRLVPAETGKTAAISEANALYDHLKVVTDVVETVDFSGLERPGDSRFKPASDPDPVPWYAESVRYVMPNGSYLTNAAYTVRLTYNRDYSKADYKEYGVTVWAGSRRYETLEEAKASSDHAVDITEAAFSDDGYRTDRYGYGVHFNVFNAEGKRIAYRAVYAQAPYESGDTYFRMQYAISPGGGRQDNMEYLDTPAYRYSAFVMPGSTDSYYRNGFQTVFLLKQNETIDSDGKRVETFEPVTETKLVPVFWHSDDVSVYAGRYEEGEFIESTTLQESAKNLTDITFGKPILYSVAAQNKQALKNYHVTFLTQTKGASLFVNGTNADDQMENGLPVRRVFIAGSEGYHDVFFANIGDEPLKNVTVNVYKSENGKPVTNAQPDVRLDEYWTVSGANRTLAAFDTVLSATSDGENVQYGYLPNVAKIRLTAAKTDQASIRGIEDILVIRGEKSDGTPVETQVQLKGTVGDIKILYPPAGPLSDGVLFVHYSRLIRTNNIYGATDVTFTVTQGQLPPGIELKPNGELYGTPTETGVFTFTVAASFSYAGFSSVDSREYTITVLENETPNVEGEIDREYDVVNWIPDIYVASDAGINSAGGVLTMNGDSYWHRGDVTTGKLITSDGYSLIQSDGNTFVNLDKGYVKMKLRLIASDGALVTSGGDASVIESSDIGQVIKDYDWFIEVRLNGRKLNAEEFTFDQGSLSITLNEQTMQGAREGRNTVSTELRVAQNPNLTMYKVAQNFNKKTGAVKQQQNQQQNQPVPVVIGGGGGGGSKDRTPYYSITNNGTAAGGFLSINPGTGSAAAGSTVTITAHPENGYRANTPTVSGGVSVRNAGTNTWTFTMPSRSVTITCSYTPTATYGITVTNPPAGGYISVSPQGSAAAGTTVTITVHLEPGFQTETPTVSGGVTPTRASGDNTWTFRMPAAAVNISAVLSGIPLNGFTDINATMWFFADAQWAYERISTDGARLIQGVTPTLWSPQTDISSLTAVITLRRLDNADLSEYYADDELTASGLSSNNAAAVRWARTNGILPARIPVNSTDKLSRGDFAIILRNFLRYRGLDVTAATETTFSDQWRFANEPDKLAAFQFLHEAGIFNGDSSNAILPQNPMRRTHLAALLHRLSNYIIQKEQERGNG